MPKHVARLKDIAVQTGFSVNTVSLALRDSPRITASTRKLIQSAADKLNYTPNQVAQSLVQRKTRSIGLILTDLGNPVLTAVAQTVELQLSKLGYSTLFATSNNALDVEDRMIQTFLSRRVDAMLIFPCQHKQLDHIRKLRNRNFPVVLMVGDRDAGVDAVCVDERLGTRKAVLHLMQNGHRRIAFIDGASRRGNMEKLDGYVAAHKAMQVPCDPDLVIQPSSDNVEAGYWAMDRLLSGPRDVSAVLAANDSLALGVLRYCSKHGIKVPQDLSIVGFDDIEFAEFAVTPLSTVHYDVARVSQLAIERVMELVSCKGELPSPRVTMVEPDLVVRESSAGRGEALEGQVPLRSMNGNRT